MTMPNTEAEAREAGRRCAMWDIGPDTTAKKALQKLAPEGAQMNFLHPLWKDVLGDLLEGTPEHLHQAIMDGFLEGVRSPQGH